MSSVAVSTGPQIQPIVKIAEQVARQRDMSVVISNASWELYETLEQELESFEPRPRLVFCNSDLEIMAPPSFDHEHFKTSIGSLVEAYAVDREIDLDGVGSTTQKIPELRGKEADESYFVNRQGSKDEFPDLVVEVRVTSGGIDKLKHWHAYKIPEVWVFEKGKLHVFEFQPDEYREIQESKLLPGLPIQDLEELALISPTTKAVREFRKRFGGRIDKRLCRL